MKMMATETDTNNQGQRGKMSNQSSILMQIQESCFIQHICVLCVVQMTSIYIKGVGGDMVIGKISPQQRTK